MIHKTLELPGKIEQTVRTEDVTKNNEFQRMNLVNIVLSPAKLNYDVHKIMNFNRSFQIILNKITYMIMLPLQPV